MKKLIEVTAKYDNGNKTFYPVVVCVIDYFHKTPREEAQKIYSDLMNQRDGREEEVIREMQAIKLKAMANVWSIRFVVQGKEVNNLEFSDGFEKILNEISDIEQTFIEYTAWEAYNDY